MCYEKDPEQCFHMKTKQILRKSVYSSSSCAMCESCCFPASPPSQAWLLSEAEFCTQVSTGMSRLHNTPVARIHRCQGSYYCKKTSSKVK